jgi:hypothetical protein
VFNKLSILCLLLLTFAASCGGNMMSTPEQSGSTPLGQSLPSVFDEFRGEATRGASDVTSILGSEALSSSGGTVDGTSMVLDSSGSAGNMAWAMYKVEGLAGRTATTLGVEMSLPTLDTQYSVGVSNFSEGAWDFLINVTGVPEYTYDLTQEEARLVSQLGNLYFVVVVSGGQSATVLQSSVLSEVETPANARLPLRAQRPSVSEGLADRIEVAWAAVEGAETYELWRRLDNPDGPWALLAVQPELAYSDTAVELSQEYAYKVRAVNAAGAGGFSEKRSGFAGAAPPNFDEGEDEDIEVEGAITALGDSSLTVAGLTFTVTANTLTTDDNGQPMGFAELSLGTVVEVEADADGAGGWKALEIEVEDGDNGGGGGDEERFEGLLTAIDATTLTIQGEVILHNAGTEFRDIMELPTTWEGFAAGDEVKVRATADENGQLVAYRVEMEDEGQGHGDDDVQRVFTGMIDSISSSEIVVDGASVAITAATTYSDNSGNAVDLAFFSAGMLVQVDALGNDVDGWRATHVQEDLEDNGDQVFTGALDSISETEIVVGGQSIILTAATTYSDNAGSAVDWSFFSSGMLVEVDASGSPEEGWTAVHVQEEIE